MERINELEATQSTKYKEMCFTHQNFLDKMLTFATSITFHSLTLGTIYLTGYLHVSPLWLLFPITFLVLKDQIRAEEEFKQQTAIRAASVKEKTLVLSNFQYLPSWVHFPDVERVEWFNMMIAQIWPSFNLYVIEVLRSSIEPAINSKLSAYFKESFKFQIMSLGTVSPRINGIKVYDKNVNRNEIVLDIHIFYAGDCDLSFKFLGITGGIQNFQIRGLVRLVMKPLLSVQTLVGGLDIYFLYRPEIDFKLIGVADVLNIPGLGSRIRTMIDDQVASAMVLPNKIHFSLSEVFEKAVFPEIEGVLCVNILEAKDLVDKDFSLNKNDKSDPYLVLSVGEQTFKSKTIQNSLNPEWNFWAEFIVKDLYGELLKIVVMDEDKFTEDSPLGNISVHIDLIKEVGGMDTWMQLEDTKSGIIHFSLFFLNLSSNKEDHRFSFRSTEFPFTSSSLLLLYIDSANNLVGPQNKQKPDTTAIISVGNKVQTSKLIVGSDSPVFDENFIFFIMKPELDKLRIKMVDQKTQNVLGRISFDLIQLLDCDNMELLDQSFPLLDSFTDSKVRLSMMLRFLKKNQ